MNPKNEIIIVGGGLAGLTCAIHLIKLGFKITLIEKQQYPQHKVCGEYISNEVLHYLKWLDADVAQFQPALLTRLSISSATGKSINCNLPLGGFGLSRFALDHFLYEKARQKGCKIITEKVTSISFNIQNSASNEAFTVNTSSGTVLTSRLVIGAYGKRSPIDQKLSRRFIQQKSPWLAVKAHYEGNFPDDLVALHNFKGGYCGVSKVENNRINICYLADYASFKKYKNIDDFQQQVLCKNPHLNQILKNSKMVFDQPITISQISFERREPVYNHILMIGDTAGLIHPLCGNGMAMAIHSARICTEIVKTYLNGDIKSRTIMEAQYAKSWNASFKTRLAVGRLLSGIIRKEKLFKLLLNLLVVFPKVLPLIVKRTHGKPLIIPKG